MRIVALGVFYISISLVGSAAIPLLQEHCMETHNSTPEEMLFYPFMGATVISFLIALLSGELLDGVFFLYNEGSPSKFIMFFSFCTFGYFSSICGTALIKRFGALVLGTYVFLVRECMSLFIVNTCPFSLRNHKQCPESCYTRPLFLSFS